MIERKCLYCGQVIYDEKHIICPECGVDLPQEMSSEDTSDGHPQELNKLCLHNKFIQYQNNFMCQAKPRGYSVIACDPESPTKPVGCPKLQPHKGE